MRSRSRLHEVDVLTLEQLGEVALGDAHLRGDTRVQAMTLLCRQAASAGVQDTGGWRRQPLQGCTSPVSMLTNVVESKAMSRSRYLWRCEGGACEGSS